MPELETRIRTYVDQTNDGVAPVTLDEIRAHAEAPVEVSVERLHRNRTGIGRWPRLVAAAAVIALLAAAVGLTLNALGDEEKPVATEVEESTRPLQAFPVDDDLVTLADFEALRRAADLERPGVGAPLEESEAFVAALERTGRLPRLGAQTFSPTEWRSELGIDTAQIRAGAVTALSSPPETTTVLVGRFSADEIDAAVRADEDWSDILTVEEHSGVEFYSWGADATLEVERGSALFPFTRRLAVIDDEMVIITRSTDAMTSAIDTLRGNDSLGDQPQIPRLVAEVLELGHVDTMLGVSRGGATFDAVAMSPVEFPPSGTDPGALLYSAAPDQDAESLRQRIEEAVDELVRTDSNSLYGPESGIEQITTTIDTSGDIVRVRIQAVDGFTQDETLLSYIREVTLAIGDLEAADRRDPSDSTEPATDVEEDGNAAPSAITRRLLDLVPETGNRSSGAAWVDADAVRQAVGADPLPAGADDAEIRAHLEQIGRIDGPPGSPATAAPGMPAGIEDPLAWWGQLGVDPARFDGWVAWGDPPSSRFVALGPFDHDLVATSVRSNDWSARLAVDEHRGITTYSWGEDHETHLDALNEGAAPSILSLRVALVDDALLMAHTTDDIHRLIDHQLDGGPSLLTDDAVPRALEVFGSHGRLGARLHPPTGGWDGGFLLGWGDGEPIDNLAPPIAALTPYGNPAGEVLTRLREELDVLVARQTGPWAADLRVNADLHDAALVVWVDGVDVEFGDAQGTLEDLLRLFADVQSLVFPKLAPSDPGTQ